MSEPDGEIEIGSDAAWVAATLVLVASLGGAVVLAEWPLGDATSSDRERPHLVEPDDGGTELWPYTSSSLSWQSRTLAINMVFYGSPDTVRTALTQRSELEWDEDQPSHEDQGENRTGSRERVRFNSSAENMSQVVTLSQAEGATRYTYFVVDGEGQWAAESYQLRSGTYFGHRMHIRAYEDPQGQWTAVQVHEEYWDWFRLRHTVTGVADPQHQIEEDFMGERYVDDVVRMPFQNPSKDSKGWATGIHIVGAILPLVLLGVTINVRRAEREVRVFFDRHSDAVGLGLALFALVTAVRHLAIAGETALPGLNTRLITAPLYVTLVLATPTIAYLYGRDAERTWAFSFAALGLGLAFVVDFAAVGVSVVPLRMVLHRIGVVLAIGLVAVGASIADDDDPYPAPLLIGLVGWAVALYAPLFGYM